MGICIMTGIGKASPLDRAHRCALGILKKAPLGDLLLGQAKTLALVVTLRSTTALGLTIPRSLLLRADQVIP